MSVKRHLSKPKPIKLLLLCLVPIAAAHNAAVGQNVNRGSPKPVRVVSIRFAQWAGMCYGYCSEDLEVSAGEAVLHQKAWGPVEQRRYPARQVRADISDKHWKTLQQLVNRDALFSLPGTIGCPDCTDGGAESVEVKFSDHTSKKITFDMGVPPKELKDLWDKLWGWNKSYLRSCRISHLSSQSWCR